MRADPLEQAAEVIGEAPGVEETRIEQEYLRVSTEESIRSNLVL